VTSSGNANADRESQVETRGLPGDDDVAAGVVAALTVAASAALSPSVASAAVERQHNAVDWVTAVVRLRRRRLSTTRMATGR
jgi:hypothetical protein